MAKNTRRCSALIAICAVLVGLSCGNDDKGITHEPPPFVLETHTGTLITPSQSTVQAEDLKVISFADSAAPDAAGQFSIDMPQTDKHQIVFLNSKSSGDPVFMGLYDPATKSMMVNDTSTALALALFNPLLAYTTADQRREYLAAVQAAPAFDRLVSQLREAYRTNAAKTLDFDANPVIYQTTAELIKEAMNSLRKAGSWQTAAVGAADPPYIEDRGGDDIAFVNPRHVWYAAGVHPDAGPLDDVVTVARKETILSFQWGWPPVVFTDPEETTYDLGDGYFKLHLTKGFDFAKIADWNDPKGRATLLNTGQSVLYIVDLVIGFVPIPDFTRLPYHLHISAESAWEIGRDIVDGDVTGFVVHVGKLLADNSEEIALWIWEEVQNDAAHQFISSAAGVLKNVAFAFKLLEGLNKQAPFFGDLVFFAPADVTYYITQSNGTLISTTINLPPQADFTITPPAGIVGMPFTFDAGLSTDDHDPIRDLVFRWDWEGDGYWDTGWRETPQVVHTYSVSDAYAVILEVRDQLGVVGAVSHTVNVGGGAGTANHVKLFRDVLPWESDAMTIVLRGLGLSPGTGANTYEIISSNHFLTEPLTPGTDLVIISNDQDQRFYDRYAQSQVRFNNFAYSGGALFWEACDNGWSEGSMSQAGIVLPGDVTVDATIDWYNYVTDQNLPLVSGLPQAMDHNFASHERLLNLPDGTTVYCVDSYSYPTLVEYNLGHGWVIISGQPLEHQYDRVYGNPDMEELLPRIVGYFTGRSVGPAVLERHLPVSDMGTASTR
ncbi:MAG TPA: hypothetical protein VM118_10190 [Acidobacteriota bacterium]|nr:hypothetical protein [Acidobacteriota bacterium]